MRLAIIGGGRAAWWFGSALRQSGWTISGIALRSSSLSRLPELLGSARADLDESVLDCDLLLVAVPDDALPLVAPHLARQSFEWAFHSSGSRPASVLGDRAFSLHPLRSLPAVGSPIDGSDALLTFEGPPSSEPYASSIASATGARLATVSSESKALYHAAAVFASNYVAGLTEIATDMFRRAGIEGDLRDDIARLALSALENWREQGVSGFTGPLARGDSGVVAGHLNALVHDPDALRVYVAAARAMIRKLAADMPHRSDFQEIARMLERAGIP